MKKGTRWPRKLKPSGAYDEREPFHITDEIEGRYMVREVRQRIHQARFRGAVDLVGVAPDYRVHVSPRLLEDEDGPMIRVVSGGVVTSNRIEA